MENNCLEEDLVAEDMATTISGLTLTRVPNHSIESILVVQSAPRQIGSLVYLGYSNRDHGYVGVASGDALATDGITKKCFSELDISYFEGEGKGVVCLPNTKNTQQGAYVPRTLMSRALRDKLSVNHFMALQYSQYEGNRRYKIKIAVPRHIRISRAEIFKQ